MKITVGVPINIILITKITSVSAQLLQSSLTTGIKQVIAEEPHSGCPLKHRAHKKSPVGVAL